MTEPNSVSDSYFLSYSRADAKLALRFATDLRERGIAMWVDQLDIRPSEHWDRAIERAVHECRGLVVILSPRSVESDNVADEISFAIDHKKPVLPVMIERCRLPLRITRMQVIDATASYERALEQCIDVLGGEGALPCPTGDAAPPRRVTDAQTLAVVKAQLTAIVGPIASILVEREAARASSTSELYRLLGKHIDSEADRERFMNVAGSPTDPPDGPPAPAPRREQSPVAQCEVERLASVLTPYLGPISGAVARRESAIAVSADDLRQRLADLIPNDRERSDFLHHAQTR